MPGGKRREEEEEAAQELVAHTNGASRSGAAGTGRTEVSPVPWRSFAGLFAALAVALTIGAIVAVVITKSRPPNFILFSHDDSLTPATWAVAYNQTIRASGARNPNGCRPPATWFTVCCLHGKPSSSCGALQTAHAHGHEVATHTMTHPQQTADFNFTTWLEEVEGQRSWAVDTCGVPAEAVVGFRAPFFQVSDELGEAIAALGFLYDSSLKGEVVGTGRVLPAGRLDGAFHPDCAHSRSTCGGWAGLPFWEVPAYMPPGHSATRSDPEPSDGMSVLQRLQADWRRKRGSGVPVAVLVHARYLRQGDRRQAVADFLRWALAQPRTWALTYRQYVEWLRAGSPPGDEQVAQLLARFPCDDS